MSPRPSEPAPESVVIPPAAVSPDIITVVPEVPVDTAPAWANNIPPVPDGGALKIFGAFRLNLGTTGLKSSFAPGCPVVVVPDEGITMVGVGFPEFPPAVPVVVVPVVVPVGEAVDGVAVVVEKVLKVVVPVVPVVVVPDCDVVAGVEFTTVTPLDPLGAAPVTVTPVVVVVVVVAGVVVPDVTTVVEPVGIVVVVAAVVELVKTTVLAGVPVVLVPGT